MTSREHLLVGTFVSLADTLVADFDVIDFLHTLATSSVGLLDADAAGSMLADPRGGLHVMASSAEDARLLELYEIQNNERPATLADTFQLLERRPDSMAWIGLCRPAEAQLMAAADQLGPHELAVEDAVTARQPPRLAPTLTLGSSLQAGRCRTRGGSDRRVPATAPQS